MESKLLRYRLQYLRALPPDGKGKSSLKAKVWAEVEEMARGAVVLNVGDEVAWNMFLESRDVGSIGELYVSPLTFRMLTRLTLFGRGIRSGYLTHIRTPVRHICALQNYTRVAILQPLACSL